ncbi:MAG TPA: DUF4139 domain-containing protein [Terracidiphilus sp.]|nr:DUF4139 domain-containing protein [Terracidiphilus sp.]
MRLVLPVSLLAFSFPVLSLSLAAQSGARSAAASRPPAQPAAPQPVKDLPVRKVVLYKNGVGYFEHAGTVNGNQRVAIDFTSSQLNDVLQSLTVLDQGGGHIANVNYNSTMPIEQQLQSLALGLNDYPPTTAIYQALRGQRVEVTGAGTGFTGRLVNIELRKETDKNGTTSEDHYFLIVETDSGALRTAELSDALSVRMLDPALEKQFSEYLGIIASAQNQQERHLTLEASGDGERQIDVSYISAVPVWKSTYRVVFPREASGNAIVQGWAVVDNTVGADWDNVQLSLVAGAPQSFIQPLSQPIYTHRPEVPIAVAQQTMPETHEAAESVTVNSEMMNGALAPPPQVTRPMAKALDRAAGIVGGIGSGYAGGVYRATDALQAGDVSTNAFDDYFEYALTQPVTIHKNESAMVPILQESLPAEHVTLWSSKQRQPLRAVWLENKSKLTLDAGSFSIFENGEFAGEGLLDPIHPNEKRLLSYAVDQAVKVHSGNVGNTRRLHHVAIHKGILVQTTDQLTDTTYTINNTADEARTVVIEHPRQPNAQLESDVKPDETTATAYRFRVNVAPHQSTDLHVAERAKLFETVRINPDEDQTDFLVTVSKYTPELEEKLRPLIEAETTLADINSKLSENDETQKALAGDEARDRDNITALKGNEAAKRFIEALSHTEDQIDAARKQQADLEKQRDTARANLDALIAKMSFDTDLDVALPTNQNEQP